MNITSPTPSLPEKGSTGFEDITMLLSTTV
jgi:hypothetical protein